MKMLGLIKIKDNVNIMEVDYDIEIKTKMITNDKQLV